MNYIYTINMKSSYYIKDLKEKYTIIIPNRTKNYISNILKNFDSTDIVKWHESIEKYVNDPFSECWLGSESIESRINSIFKYFQFLHKVDLLGKLYDYYINNIVTENEWYIILSSYDNCGPSGKQGKPIAILEPQSKSDEICNATIRNIIVEDIDNDRLKIYPAGKINNKGELIFFEYE